MIDRLAECYPDWREYHSTPIEAGVEIGLLDESALTDAEVPELDFTTATGYSERQEDFDL